MTFAALHLVMLSGALLGPSDGGVTPPRELLERAGTYVVESDRRELFLTPRNAGGQWVLVFTDLERELVRGLFPGGDDECLAGESMMQPEPVAFGIHFLRGTQGAIDGLELYEHATDTAWTARRAPERIEPIEFTRDGVTFEGGLHLPAGAGPFPAVVLAHGSEGGQDRYSFDALPNVLARHGVAVLAYDKRGCGESGGNWDVDHDTLAGDLLAGIACLRSRPEIGARLGVIGFSEGAWIAPLAASRSKEISFVVALSGGALPKWESFLHQAERRARDQGLEGGELEQARAEARETIEACRRRLADGEPTPFDLRMLHDPTPQWRDFRGPVLFLIGAFDVLVPPERSAEHMRSVLTEAKHPDFTIQIFQKAHHGMFLGTTGTFAEFAGMQGIGAYAPGYWKTLLAWIDERVKR